MDADTLIEADGLQRMVRPFLYATDVVATGGTIRVVNGSLVKHGRVEKTAVPTHLLAGIQVVEYLRAFLFGRLGWNRLGGNIIISGAFGLFQKEYVMAGGRFSTRRIVEDPRPGVRPRWGPRANKIKIEKPFLSHPAAWAQSPR